MEICIASENALVRNLLHAEFAKKFRDVRSAAGPEAFLRANDPAIPLFWEVSDAAHCVALLEEHAAEGADLHNVMLILRHEDQFDQLRLRIGQVGAVLPPSVAPPTLLRLVGVLTQDLCVLPRAYVRQWSEPPRAPVEHPAALDLLTPRERMVLKHLGAGNGDKMIAASLQISHSTVRVHVRSVLRKLGLQNRLQAALWAAQLD